MICPLLSNPKNNLTCSGKCYETGWHDCEKEKCTWYDNKNACCIIRALSGIKG